ncbi:equilibrative nucleoside transporter 1 [Arctopsyche grandis]|uniref:equilibrative nucleoside transporter 1 n=1 Tax=Arctopsyche grandis TaxID=121162 RepID=UPI00406D98C5
MESAVGLCVEGGPRVMVVAARDCDCTSDCDCDCDCETETELAPEAELESRELVPPHPPPSHSPHLSKSPHDNYYMVYCLFYLYGITSMMPWNFFVTANDYWMYKFRDVTPHNGTISIGKTSFQAEFTSYLNIAASIPSTICLIFNMFISHLIPLNIRIISSLSIITLFFALTTVLVQVDTDNWQDEFFIVTMITVVIINGAGAVFGGSLFGIAGKFESSYMAAVINGQALGGVIAAIAQILSLAFKVSATHSAFIYFMIGDFMIMFSLFSYIRISRVEYFKYYIYGSLNDTGISTNNRMTYVSSLNVLKKIWVYALSLGIVFVTTTSIYPGVTVLVESHHSGAGGDWNNVYFVPVVNYLIYNTGDYAGRVLAGFILKPRTKSWIVAAIAIARIAIVPLFMMCNAHPRSHLPVIINSDTQYILLMLIFAMTNGYEANISMINAARVVENHEKERASILMGAVLGIGISIGAAIGMCLVRSL